MCAETLDIEITEEEFKSHRRSNLRLMNSIKGVVITRVIRPKCAVPKIEV